MTPTQSLILSLNFQVPLYIHETIWCIFSMFIGVIITTLTIANLQLLVINLDASRLNFQQKIELIKKFMHYRNLPPYLQDRMLSFYEYQWTVLKGADEEKVSDVALNCLCNIQCLKGIFCLGIL